MRNSYPGICYRCHKKVDVRQGHFEKIPYEKRTILKIKAKWRLQHADCAIIYRNLKYEQKLIEINKNEIQNCSIK